MKFKFNVPNKITLIRISLIPLFVIVLNAELQYRNLFSAFIFGMLSISDFFDGYIARKKKQVTNFGKLIDPIADKILISTALIFLISRGVELWMAIVIISREIILTAIRIYLLPSKLVVPASNFGKAKTVVQSLAIVAVLLGLGIGYYMMLAAVILTVVSGIEYLFRIKKLTGKKIVNLPNLITLTRFLLIAPFVYYFLKPRIYIAIIIFAVITLSDKLDGLSARLMNQKTILGSALDSFTDWAFIFTALMTGVYANVFSFNIGILFIVSSMLIFFIKLYYLKKRKELLTSIITKITVGSAYVTILALLINFAYKDIIVMITLILSYSSMFTFAAKAILQKS